MSCKMTPRSSKSIWAIARKGYNAMLHINDYHVSYGQSEILHGLDFQIGEGEIVAMTGRNGMGKTTMMKALMGIIPTRSGSLTFEAKEMSGLQTYERVREGVAYVPQGRMIFATMTVEENIETGLAGTSKTSIPGDVYEIFPVLWEMRKRRGGNLSGGQQQQLAIARALVSDPKVLLLDEPYEGLAPVIVDEIEKTLRIIKEQGITTILVEQNAVRALELADRAVILDTGSVVFDGSAAEVLGNAELRAEYLAI